MVVRKIIIKQKDPQKTNTKKQWNRENTKIILIVYTRSQLGYLNLGKQNTWFNG